LQYDIEVDGRVRRLVVNREEGRFRIAIDGRNLTVNAVRVGANALSLLIVEQEAGAGSAGTAASGPTSSHEITLATDAVTGHLHVNLGRVVVPVVFNGRRRAGRKEEGGHSGASGANGPHRVVAPMPGKVARVLVTLGDTVGARQPIAVIEAMKMENELRAGRDGVITELPVASGQSVDAGTLVAVIAATPRTGGQGPPE
jgi:biotin carboxyl carrier protein